MSGNTRISDFLYLHANVSRRVRNLETGVHPVSTETGLDDTYGLTALTILPTELWHYGSGTATTRTLMWQRRAGVVTLVGGVEPKTGNDWTDVPAETHVATLPAEARPITELLLNGAANDTPWLFQYRVQTNGHIVVNNPGGYGGLRFEGANWTIT